MKYSKKSLIIFGLFMLVLMFGSSLILRSMRGSVDGKNRPKHSSSVVRNITDKKEGEKESKMIIVVGEDEFEVELEDNESARALVRRLPIYGEFQELNGNEKYLKMDKALSSSDEAVGNIAAGDVMLYNSDTLVIFYKSFATSYKYTKIGHISNTANLEEKMGDSNIEIIIRR